MNDDSLSAAIAGTQRGERWEDADGRVLNISKTGYVSVGTEQLLPSLTSWHRVDAPVLCPRCGKEIHGPVPVLYRDNEWGGIGCGYCDLEDHALYPTKAEALAAWARIGSQWHRPEERPPRKGWYPVLFDTNGDEGVIADSDWWDGERWDTHKLTLYAWMDPPPPPWAKEGGSRG